MSDISVPTELIDHLCRCSRLTAEEAEHIVSEVLSYYSETPEDYVRHRHQELQALGKNNSDIYSTLQAELQARRFGAKPLTTRQIRRTIYG